MKFNKTMAKALVFTMALSVLPLTARTTANAAAPTAAFDGAKGILKSTNATHWGIAVKEKKKPKKLTANHLEKNGVFYKIKQLETISGSEIDLGKYKGKAIFVVVGSSSDFSKPADWVVTEIKAADKKFKPYYFATGTKNKILVDTAKATGDDTTGYLTFIKEGKQMDLAGDDGAAEKVEVRAGSGDWTPAKTYFGNSLAPAEVKKKLSALIQNGAKLSFRLAGSTDSWGSKEIKLNIPSQKKGPSVKLDFTKDTTNLKSTMEYKLVGDDAAAPTNAFEQITDKLSISSLTDLKNTGEGEENLKPQDLYVRTKKTEKNMPTKFTKIKIKKQAKLTVAKANLDAQGGEIITGNVSFNLKVPHDVEKGAILSNNSIEKDYEFAVSYDGSEDKLKWITLRKAKEAGKPTKLQIKASKSTKPGAFNPDKSSKLFIRLPGVKQDKNNVITLPSPKAEVALKVEKIAQDMTITTASNNTDFIIASQDAKAFTLKLSKASEKEFTIAAKITNVTKKDGKVKLKVTTSIPGVKVTADSLSEVDTNNAAFNISINVSNTAFKEAPSGKLLFDVEYESLKKDYTITFDALGG